MVELIKVNKKLKNFELSNETWGNASQGRGLSPSTKDYQGEGPGGPEEELQGGSL